MMLERKRAEAMAFDLSTGFGDIAADKPRMVYHHRIEEFPYEIGQAHIDYLDRIGLHAREKFRAAEKHDGGYAERDRNKQQIRAQLAEPCAGAVNHGSHDRVIEGIPEAHYHYHSGNRFARYAENGDKEEGHLHTHHVVTYDLAAVCDAVKHRFFDADVSFLFHHFVI